MALLFVEIRRNPSSDSGHSSTLLPDSQEKALACCGWSAQITANKTFTSSKYLGVRCGPPESSRLIMEIRLAPVPALPLESDDPKHPHDTFRVSRSGPWRDASQEQAPAL